jgi:hypothetical protein
MVVVSGWCAGVSEPPIVLGLIDPPVAYWHDLPAPTQLSTAHEQTD